MKSDQLAKPCSQGSDLYLVGLERFVILWSVRIGLDDYRGPL